MNKEEYERQKEKRKARRNEKVLYERLLENRARRALISKSWRQRAKRLFAWWRQPSDRFAFFLALFTGVLALVAYWQLSTMRGQLDAMEADQRPWVYMTRSEVVEPGLQFTKDGASIGIRFRYKNVGHSPAKFTFLLADLLVVTTTDEYSNPPFGLCDARKQIARNSKPSISCTASSNMMRCLCEIERLTI